MKNGLDCSKEEELRCIVETYPEYLTQHLDASERLGLYEKTFWDKSVQTVGHTATKVLKGSAGLAIISTFAICPAAAAIPLLLKGSYRDSCEVLNVQEFSSNDYKFRGNFVVLEAKCKYDREDHGLKTNTIVVPENGACDYLHNINGTLLATDGIRYSGEIERVKKTDGCPELTGSFTKTCGRVISEPYKSSDKRIPEGALCHYDVESCKKKDHDFSFRGRDNELVIPKAEVMCQGSKIENCDGTLVIRKSGQSDRQCGGRHDEL